MNDLTEQLRAWSDGNESAYATLLPPVYAELRRIAGHLMRDQGADHTLQPTALANEAWLKLGDSNANWTDRTHFYAVAARAMRQILVDHARGLARDKRSGGMRVTLRVADAELLAADETLLALEAELTTLETSAPRAARVTELHYFGGMTYHEIADVLGISPATVDRELRFARAWLAERLDGS